VVRYSFIVMDLHHLLLAGFTGAHPSDGQNEAISDTSLARAGVPFGSEDGHY
jgi:hypothetical protein